MRKKIFLYGFAVSIIAVLLTGIIAFVVMRASGINEAKLSAQSLANVVLNDIDGSEAESIYDEKAKTLAQRIDSENELPYRITIIAQDGRVLGDSNIDINVMDNHADRPEVIEAVQTGVGSATRSSDTLRTNMLYVAVKDNDSEMIVRIALPLAELQRMSYNLLLGCILGIIAGAMISLLASFVFARKLALPIQSLTSAVAGLAAGNMGERVELNTNTELDGLAQDINEMAKKLEQSLAQLTFKNAEFHAVLSSMENGLIAVDKNKEILYINPAAKKIFGVCIAEKADGMELTRIVYQKPLIDAVKKCLKEKSTQKIELKIGGKKILDYKLSVCPMFNRAKIAGAIILLTDITHMVELEKLRSDFVANVSHELRTPLTSIKGYAETLKDEGLTSKQNALRFLDIIEIEADRLNLLINDLMELSKIENKSDDINIALHKFMDIAAETSEIVSLPAGKKNVEIILDIQDDLNILANRDRIKQLLLNLMDNGIKYNKQGGKLYVTALKDNDMLKICVKDTGEGIAEQDMPRLFERFYRIDKSRSRELGGTGLGLSIVKHIAELYRGSITVQSEKGVGTEFIIRLPILSN